MTRFASMRNLAIAVAIIGVCMANAAPEYDDNDNNQANQGHHGHHDHHDHHDNPDHPAHHNNDKIPEHAGKPNWEDDEDYKVYKHGKFYLSNKNFLYNEDGKAIYNADNGKLLLGPDGKAIVDYKGNHVYVPKDFPHLWNQDGTPKYNAHNGAVLYGPHCVPLVDCYGRIIYGPCQYLPQKPNTPTPVYNPNPVPVPRPNHPVHPEQPNVPYVRERELPKYKPSQIRDPNPIVIKIPDPVDIKRPAWEVNKPFYVPIPVIKDPKAPKLPNIKFPPILKPIGLPGQKPIIKPIIPPKPVAVPIPYGNCLNLFWRDGTPYYNAHNGKLVYGPNAPVKTINGEDVYGPVSWPDLYKNGKPLFNENNGLPVLGPDQQPIRLAYPYGAIVYGPKVFYKPYPDDDYKGPIVVGDAFDNEYLVDEDEE